MRPIDCLLRSTLVLVVLASACGGDDDATPGGLEGARLEFVSPRTQSLRYDAMADLSVRYVRADGSPIGGAVIAYEIDGFAAEATLAARQADTADDGMVNVPLSAGAAEATFQVIVTPPVGDAVRFSIAVADFEAGSITVELGYMGMKRFDSFEAFLFDDQTCGDISDPDMLPTALFAAAPVLNITDQPAFVPVAVGLGYTVAVQANIGDLVEGFGCTGGIDVELGKEEIVQVDILDVDQPIFIEGPYELESSLDFGGLLPPSVERAVDILDELTDDQDIMGNPATMDFGQDPGAFFVDFAMRQTCHWECASGEDYDTCSETNHRNGDISAIYLQSFRTWGPAEARFFGGCGAWEDAMIPAQNLLNDQINMAVPGAVTMFAMVAGDMARAINQAQVTSILTLDPADEGMADFTHELRQMQVTLHDLTGAEHFYMFDLRDVGFSAVPTADAVAMIAGRHVELAEHSFALEYGRLLQYIYLNGLLPLLGFTSTGDMLRSWIDCASVGRSLAMSVGVLSEMDYTSACNAGLDLAGTTMDTLGIAAFVDDMGTLTLAGSADGAMIGTDGIAQSLENGMWSGTWGESGMTGAINGTFTGTRR